MALLHSSRRCKLFEKIADEVWQLVVRNHNTTTQVNEPGVTNNIIARIRHDALSYPNIGIWANNAFKEVEHGSDIDIFVETVPGVYIWWALQAKVLRLSGRYEGVRGLHNGEYQWDKLIRLSSSAGCISRYLLYNGVDNFSYTGFDTCGREFNQRQFGCSLVKLEDFKRIAITRNPNFNDFHPSLASPWRIITCCLNSIKDEKLILYTAKQIKKAVTYYPESNKTIDFIQENSDNLDINDLSENFINEISEQFERKSEFRIVIRTSKSLNEETK